MCFLCEGDRSSAAGNHSPETFISHYPERERAAEREKGRERQAEKEVGGERQRGDGQIKMTERGRDKREKQTERQESIRIVES